MDRFMPFTDQAVLDHIAAHPGAGREHVLRHVAPGVSGSFLDGRKPRRRQKSAAPESIAWTINARPPINCAAVTVR